MKKMMIKATALTAAMMTAATVFAVTPAPVFAAEKVSTKTNVSSEVTRCLSYDYVFTLDDIDTQNYSYGQPVTIINNTGKIIERIYISPSAVSDWGNDVLGDDVMMNGDLTNTSFSVYGNYTVYDIRCDYLDGTQYFYTYSDFSDVPVDGFILELDSDYIAYI